MEVRQLEIFAAVADEASFTRAARRLFAAQSTVSSAVRALETELGTSLFERSTRSVALTPVGEAVLAEAREVLEAADRMHAAASPDPAELRGRVRVGLFNNLDMLDLPAIFGRFHRDYPRVNLQLAVSPSGSAGLLDDVRRGRLDVAFIGLSARELEGLHAIDLGETEFQVLLPADHRLARRADVALEELADEPFVDAPLGFGNRIVLDRAYATTGRTRNIVAIVPDLTAIPPYVAAGLGVAILPDITEFPDGIAVRPLRPRLPWSLSAVSLPAAVRSPAVVALLELLHEHEGALTRR